VALEHRLDAPDAAPRGLAERELGDELGLAP
jgi:hypothetical protein